VILFFPVGSGYVKPCYLDNTGFRVPRGSTSEMPTFSLSHLRISGNEMLPVAVVCVQNPDGLPLGIAREVWKRHAKAFFWVRPLA
jgi:hypothetical protein